MRLYIVSNVLHVCRTMLYMRATKLHGKIAASNKLTPCMVGIKKNVVKCILVIESNKVEQWFSTFLRKAYKIHRFNPSPALK